MSDRLRVLIVGAAPLLGVLTLSFVTLVLVSKELAPAFDEVARLEAVTAAEAIIREVAAHGPTALAPKSIARAGRPPILGLLGAWSEASLGRAGVVDRLTAVRLPWLVLGALSAGLVFAMVRRSRGRAVALVAALLFTTSAPMVHAFVVGSEAALATFAFLVVLAPYTRTLGVARCRAAWSAVTGALFGVAIALSFAAIYAALLIMAHFAWTRRRTLRRVARSGRISAPPALVFMLSLGPLVALGCTPSLWGAPVPAIASFCLSPLAAPPAKELGSLRATLVLEWLVSTTPFVMQVAFLVGIGVVVYEGLSRRFATGGRRARRDPVGLAALAALGLVGAVLAPLAPPVLAVAPPRFVLALPFALALAAIGVERATRAAGPILGRVALTVVVVAVAWLGLREQATSSLPAAAWLGGARGGAVDRLHLGDGSELGAVLAPLSGKKVHAPGVPSAWFEIARRFGRQAAATTVVTSGKGAEYTLERGAGSGGPVAARVTRDGRHIWTLTGR